MARKKTVKSETTDLAQPQNRTEEFLAKIAGLVDTLPQGEFSRLERYLKYIAENGGGGGGGVTSFNTRTGAVVPQSGDYSEFFAPAGYGLGTTTAKVLTDADDLNNITACGFYGWGAAIPANAPTLLGTTARHCVMLVTNTVQCVYSGNHQTMAIRLNAGDRVWEYINPSMNLGTEYRTTERHMGLPVYVKRLSFTTLEITGTTTIAHGITNLSSVLFLDGLMGGWTGIQYPVGAYSPVTGYTIDDTNITVTTQNATNPRSAISFLLKYTKTA